MAVLVEGISVIIQISTILNKYQGGGASESASVTGAYRWL